MRDSSPLVRTQAVRALSHFRTDAVIDALRIKLQDDETEEGSVVPTPREVAIKILTAWSIIGVLPAIEQIQNGRFRI